jgi:enamine deaminase RidA (YjgF/YER057c/UK114 family)
MGVRAHLQSERLCQPIGLYSHGFVSAGVQRTLYVAGQLAVGAGQKSVGEDDFEGQFRQVFANFGAVLEAAGMTFDHVVKFTTYVTDPARISEFYRVRAKVFPGLFTATEYPPNLGLSAGSGPGLIV